MKKPYISIIFPTMRPGGLDTIFNSLEHQTFKDFELIICDSLYQYRKNIVKEMAQKFSFRYTHMPTIIDKFPIQSYCHAMNSAITRVNGDVILFTTDYRYFMPSSLEKHVNFHKSHSDNFGYAPPSKFVIPPAQKKIGLPAYGNNTNYKQYAEDLRNGKLQDYMWSIFEKGFFESTQNPSSWQELDRLKVGYDPKADVAENVEVSPMVIFLQSESIKTKLVLEANGLNEALDGAHSHQDIEFSHRLRNLFDFKWIGDNTNPVYKVIGGHDIINKIQLIESIDNSAQSIFDKYQSGSKDLVNSWSLSQVHNLNQKYFSAV